MVKKVELTKDRLHISASSVQILSDDMQQLCMILRKRKIAAATISWAGLCHVPAMVLMLMLMLILLLMLCHGSQLSSTKQS